jgi:uncharacterized protein YdhG (YjbR/CyaY superfamily)
MRAKAAMKRSKPTTIDEYLARIPPDQRSALEQLRRQIRSAVPAAEECISYGLPAFRHNGRMLAWFGAAKNHCSFYPGGVVRECQDELKKYETSKGTIRFQPDEPLPARLVKKLLKARIAANVAASRVSRS